MPLRGAREATRWRTTLAPTCHDVTLRGGAARQVSRRRESVRRSVSGDRASVAVAGQQSSSRARNGALREKVAPVSLTSRITRRVSQTSQFNIHATIKATTSPRSSPGSPFPLRIGQLRMCRIR